MILRLHVEGDDIGTPDFEKIDAGNALSSTQQPSRKLGVKPQTSWTKFTLGSPASTPSCVLDDEVVLQNNETWNAGTNSSDLTQISLSSAIRSWCIAKSNLPPDPVQNALDSACGPGGADCEPIQLGNACFIPNTVYSHASYAFNSYYQVHQHASETCDFGGTATVVYEDPSYPGCPYPFRSGQPGAPVIGEGSKSPISSMKGLIAMSILVPMWVF